MGFALGLFASDFCFVLFFLGGVGFFFNFCEGFFLCVCVFCLFW